MKKLFLFSMLLLLFTVAFADIYTIGDGTSTQYYSPFYGLFDFSWNKVIYTKAEINAAGLNAAGDITGFGFYVGNTPSNYLMQDQRVYIRHTTATAYETTDLAYPGYTGFSYVYQGDITYNGSGWYYLIFTTPFNWNNTDNLEVLYENWVDDYVTGYPQFRYTSTTPDYRTVYRGADTTFPTTDGTRTLNRSNIAILTPWTTAPDPTTLVSPTHEALNVWVNETLNWNPVLGATGYKLYFGTDGGGTSPPINIVPGTNLGNVLTYDPTPDMDPTTIHYWQIVPTNAIGDATGCPIWSFTTSDPPLTGIKYIGGTTPDYTTFTDAINALNATGVGGTGVTFNVAADAVFAEDLPEITVSGTATQQIIFQKSGAGANPVINPSTATAGISILGGDYITFDGIDITRGAGSTDYGYSIKAASSTDGAQYNTIKNCKITLDKTDTGTKGIYHYYTQTPADYTGTNSHNEYYNITVENSYYGMYIYSYSSSLEDNNEIHGCTIGGETADNIGPYGIYTYYETDISIHDNEIRNLGHTSTLYGIDIYYPKGTGNEVYNNKVHDLAYTSTSTSINYGIYLYPSSTYASTVKVYNNMIWGQTHSYTGSSTTKVIYGIYVGTSNSSFEADIDFNSVRVVGPATASSFCVGFGSVSGTHYLRNNVLTNYTGEQTTSYHGCIYTTSSANVIGQTGSVSDNNILYVDNATQGYTAYGSTSVPYANLSAWSTATGYDLYSYDSDPEFISATDLHISTTEPTRVESNGSYFEGAIDWVTDDIDPARTVRNTTTPDIGADEGDFTPVTGPPFPPQYIEPLEDAENVLLSQILNWAPSSEGGPPTSYDVYFDDFDGTSLVSEGQVETTYTPTLSYGTTYFWKIVAINDIDEAAGPVWSFTTAVAPLTGNKYIGGATPDYTSFTDAINALTAAGVGAGGVTFLVAADAVFAEDVPEITVTGTASQPIVFQKSGAGANPVIKPITTTAGISILGGDYFTFDGIDITREGASTTDYGYSIKAASSTDGAQYNAIKNCKITMDNTDSGTRGIYHYYTTTPTDYTGTNSNNEYSHITVENSYYGIYMYGTSSTTYLEDNNSIHDCTIGGSSAGDISGPYGMYLYYQKDLEVSNNEVRNLGYTSTVYGMYMYYMKGTENEVYNNKVHDIAYTGTTTSANYGMYIYLYTTGANEVKVYNNMVWGQTSGYTGTGSTSYAIYGIYMSSAGSSNTYNVDFNSVRVEGPSGMSSAALYFTSTSGVNKIRNNVLTNFTGEDAYANYHVCLYMANATSVGATGSVSDHNVMYVTNGYPVRGSTTNYATLGEWQTASGMDLNSFSNNPQFISASDLHISATAPTVVESNGSYFEGAITWVPFDIDPARDTRNATTPDIGADEGEFTPPAGAPDHVVLQSPTYDEDNINPDTSVLSWQAADTGGLPDYYEVYMSLNDPIDPGTSYYGSLVAETTFTSLDISAIDWSGTDYPGGMGFSETWYWAVLPYNGDPPESPDPEGPGFMIWRFNTIDDPTITVFPFTEGFEVGNTQGSSSIFQWTQDVGPTYTDDYWTANSTLTTYNRTPRTGSFNVTLHYTGEAWLFRPISLTGGISYDIELYARQDGSTSTNANVGICYGDAGTIAAMTNTIVPQTGIINGDYQRIYGSFTPTVTGTYYIGIKGWINISPWYISLDDIYIQVTPTEPIYSITPENWDYGDVEIDNPSVQTFQIANIGVSTIDLDVGDIYITNDTGNEFIVTADNLPVSLARDETYNFTVTFTPLSVGPKTATLNVQDNIGARVLHTYNLSGNCVLEEMMHIYNLQGIVSNINDVQLTWQGFSGIPNEPGWLHYDSGTNNNSIGITDGNPVNFDVAMKLASSVIEGWTGMDLTKISFWPGSSATSTNFTLKIWTGDDINLGPTTLVYSQPVTTPVLGAWNEITLTTPFPITGTTAVWIGYNSDVLATGNYPAGCDAGPAVQGYGDLLNTGGTWHSLGATSTLNYNWNLQAYVDDHVVRYAGTPTWLNIPVVNNPHPEGFDYQEMASIDESNENASERGLQGFNIFRDDVQINTALVTAYTYSDLDLEAATYEYKVQAVHYSQNGPMSDPVEVLIPANDLAATAIAGDFYGIAGDPVSFDVTVFNNGTTTQSSYTVKLMDSSGPTELASQAFTTPIASAASEVLTVYWTPLLPNVYEVYAQVVLAGDQIAENDSSSPITIYVIPSTFEVLSIGNPATTLSSAAYLWYFYYKNNVAESIYFADELHMTSGDVAAIAYKNTFIDDLPDKSVKIYMANTLSENVTTGWSTETLTLVYDGTVNFPIGVNEIVIPLQTPFSYTGGNLLVRVYRNYEETTYSTSDKFYYTSTSSTHPNRTRYYYSNTAVFDPLNPALVHAGYSTSNVVNTWLMFNNAVLAPQAQLDGYVYQFGTTTPIEGATVTLSDERYSTTTDINGYYSFSFWEAHPAVTVTASKFGYYDQTVTSVALPLGTPVAQNFYLTPMPRVTVSGIVTSNDIPGGLVGAEINLYGIENQSELSTTGGAFSIPDVLGSTTGLAYTVEVKKDGYQTYSGSTTVYETAVNLGTINLIEYLWTPYNLVATHSGTDAQLVWEAAAAPEFYFSDFEDDNGGWVESGYGDWEWTNTYNVTLYNPSGSTSTQTPPPAAHSGTGLLGTIIYGPYSNSGAYSYLTQTFDFSGYNNTQFRYWLWNDLWGYWDYLTVRINGTTVDSVIVLANTSWQERVIDLTAYDGLSDVVVTIAMFATTGVNYSGAYIDDIYIGPATARIAENERWLLDYDVYRFLAADEGNPGAWTQLETDWATLSYLDTGFGSQPVGAYKWAVKANYSGAQESEAIISNTLGIVGIPQDITATTVGANVVLNWTAEPGASYYIVYASDDPYGAFTFLGYSATNSYNVIAPAAMKKFYKVTAADGEIPARGLIRN